MKTINKTPLTPLVRGEQNSHFPLTRGIKGVSFQNKKAFTLVELIIVITILAILSTIAFVWFQNFTKDSRDWNRITTLKNIESWLSLYTIRNNNYPDPDELVEILWTWNILLSKQWIVWNEVVQKIKLNKEALDPKDKTNYIYSITWNGKKYQLWTYLEENKLISYIPQITQTYANIDYTNRYFYTIWHKVWILLEDETQKPILKTQTLTWINLSTNTDDFKVYFSNDTQSWSYTNSWIELITIIKENQKTIQTIKTPITYTITATAWSNWSVSCTQTTVNHWSDVTCTASPAEPDYVVDTWAWCDSTSWNTCNLTNVIANKTVSVSFKPSCQLDQILTNGYFVINSSSTNCTTWCNWSTTTQTINGTTYYRDKCILKITSVTPNIYVAPSNSDTTTYTHWNADASWCTDLTTTCSQLIWTTNWNAATFCTNLKNTIPPPVWTNWFLPPRDTWWLQTIQENISKVNHDWDSSWYWSSSFYGWYAFDIGWGSRRLDAGGVSASDWDDDHRVRCIAK